MLGDHIGANVRGVPNACEGEIKGVVAHKQALWLHKPCHLRVPNETKRVPNASHWGKISEMAQNWPKWPQNPCRLGGHPRFRAGDKIGATPQVGMGGYIILTV